MFPMNRPDNCSVPPLPLMMGVIAGQQAMQRAEMEEQTRLLEEQVWWQKWQEPVFQKNFATWWFGC